MAITGLSEAGELVRQHGHLFLSREDHIDTLGLGHLQRGFEPGQGVVSERRHHVQRTHVAGETGQADVIGDRGRHPVSLSIQQRGHLAGGQSRPFSQEDVHRVSI